MDERGARREEGYRRYQFYSALEIDEVGRAEWKIFGIRAIKGESGDASPRFSHWPVMKSNVSYVFVRRGPSFGFLSFSRRTRFCFLGSGYHAKMYLYVFQSGYYFGYRSLLAR